MKFHHPTTGVSNAGVSNAGVSNAGVSNAGVTNAGIRDDKSNAISITDTMSSFFTICAVTCHFMSLHVTSFHSIPFHSISMNTQDAYEASYIQRQNKVLRKRDKTSCIRMRITSSL